MTTRRLHIYISTVLVMLSLLATTAAACICSTHLHESDTAAGQGAHQHHESVADEAATQVSELAHSDTSSHEHAPVNTEHVDQEANADEQPKFVADACGNADGQCVCAHDTVRGLARWDAGKLYHELAVPLEVGHVVPEAIGAVRSHVNGYTNTAHFSRPHLRVQSGRGPPCA